MSAWIFFLILALIFFIIEIYTPTMFFLNFAIASAFCGIFGIFIDNYNLLIPLFVILSILFLLFLRPFFNINPQKNKEQSFESPYIGKQATALTNITVFTGRIQIYDENWEARLANEDDEEIKQGSKVNIIRHNDLTMYVTKKEKK